MKMSARLDNLYNKVSDKKFKMKEIQDKNW